MNNTIVGLNGNIQSNLYQAARDHANSQEDLKSHISRGSLIKELYQKNYQSLTPAKHASNLLNPSSSALKNGNQMDSASQIGRNQPKRSIQTLDDAIAQERSEKKNAVISDAMAVQDQMSTTSSAALESYKKRSKSYFNPLDQHKDYTVNIPDQIKISPQRTPFYRQ